jgi:uncharacterized protein (DUF2147 family)
MKKAYLLAFAAMFAAAPLVMAQSSDPVLGYWKSYDEKTGKLTAGWEIYLENGKLYGKILALADFAPDTLASNCTKNYPDFPIPGKVSEMKVIGPPWIWGLSQKKPGEWSDGRIIDPDKGEWYYCRIYFRPKGAKVGGKTYPYDVLEMRGNLVGNLGRSQYWQKGTRAEILAIK